MLTTTSGLKYWRGSSPGTRQSQEVDTYNYHAVNVFKLKGVSDFASGRFKLMEHLAPSGRVGFVAEWQKSLLKSLAYFSYTQFDDPSANASCGYSLRIVYHPVPQGSKSTEVYFLARVASNSSPDIIKALQKKQAQHINISLRSPLYQFEENTDNKFDWLPSWLESSQPLSCNEIIKSEEIFQWLDSEDKQRQNFYYSPGRFQVNKANNMVALFEQLQGYKQPVCIDLTLVPTGVEGYEKKTMSRYLEVLNQISKGIREEGIDPDSNTQRVKSVYEDIKKRYSSGIVFLYSFRVFSPDGDTCQSVANLLAATCMANTVSQRVVKVIDSRYAVQTALQVNINEQACMPGIWDTSGKILPGFPGGPGMLKRLHRLIDLDEAAAFFRLPIPINQPCAGVECDTLNVSISSDEPTDKFPLKLDIEDIIRDYGSLITEDTYIVGIDQDGKPCVSDFSKIPHRIVAGTTGTGKTNFLTSMIYQFLYASFKIQVNREIYIADFKAGFDYYRIERRNESVKLVTKAEDLVTLLEKLWNEYERRLTTMIDEDVESLKELREKCNSQEHRIILVIDEAASILSAERKSREEISKYLQELAAKSRVTGIHIFYCSQRPTPDVIPRLISDNMDERVIFRVFPAASQLLLDDDVAAELPADPKGRSVYRGLESQLKIVATPYVPKQVWNNPFG
jgi:FtsK/SpoIIIE family